MYNLCDMEAVDVMLCISNVTEAKGAMLWITYVIKAKGVMLCITDTLVI